MGRSMSSARKTLESTSNLSDQFQTATHIAVTNPDRFKAMPGFVPVDLYQDSFGKPEVDEFGLLLKRGKILARIMSIR
jgi:hypothetical protein